MKIGIVVGILLALMSLPCLAIAAESQEVTLDAKQMPISQAMTEIGKQAGVRIVCDTDVSGTVTGQFPSIELEALLSTIVKLDDLKWEKVYLPVQEDKPLTLEQIKARAEAVTAAAGSPVILYDPTTGKQRVFVEQDPAAPSLSPDKLGLKPIYFISKPKVETAADSTKTSTGNEDPVAQFQSLQNDRLKMLMGMTPDQRISALQGEMTYMMQMDPAVRQQMMLDQFNARQNMDPQTRDQLRQMMRDTWHSMRDQGLIPQDAGGPGGFGGPGGGGGRHGTRGGDTGSQPSQ